MVMVGVAAGRGRLRTLVASNAGMIWLGGIVMLTSGFFRQQNVMGLGMSAYGCITWNLSFAQLPYLLLLGWPVVFGALIVVMSFLSITTSRRRIVQVEFAVLGLLLCLMAGNTLVGWIQMVAKHGLDKTHMPGSAYYLGRDALLFVAAAATLFFGRTDHNRKYLLYLMLAVWSLAGLFPAIRIVEWWSDLPLFGAGYWLLVLGSLLILIASLVALLRGEAPLVGHCRRCGYNLTGLIDPRCPECGTAFKSSRVQEFQR